MSRSVGLVMGAGALLLVAGCATHSDLESLRSEVANLRAQVTGTDAKATAAQNDATIARRQSEDTNQKVSALYNKMVHHAPSPPPPQQPPA